MVSDHMKNCALSRIYVLKTALPDQHGFVKLKTIANVRLARFFFFPSLFKRRQTKPPEGFKTRVILRCAQDDSLRLNGLECDALRSKRGGVVLLSVLYKSQFRFYIPHWWTASKSWQGVRDRLAPEHEFLGTKAFLVHTVRAERRRPPPNSSGRQHGSTCRDPVVGDGHNPTSSSEKALNSTWDGLG